MERHGSPYITSKFLLLAILGSLFGCRQIGDQKLTESLVGSWCVHFRSTESEGAGAVAYRADGSADGWGYSIHEPNISVKITSRWRVKGSHIIYSDIRYSDLPSSRPTSTDVVLFFHDKLMLSWTPALTTLTAFFRADGIVDCGSHGLR